MTNVYKNKEWTCVHSRFYAAKMRRDARFGCISQKERTDLAYSVGVMPNLSLNWREKWCTVEYCSAAAISEKFIEFSAAPEVSVEVMLFDLSLMQHHRQEP